MSNKIINLSKITCATVFFLISIEVFLKITKFQTANLLLKICPDYIPTCAKLHHDNLKNTSFYKTKEFGANLADIKITYNSFGLRGPEPDGRKKILLLGDSFIEADEIAYENTLGYLLEKQNPTYQVLQKGFRSWSPAIYLAYLYNNLNKLNPKKIFIFLCWNDFYPWTTARNSDESYFYHSTNPLEPQNLFQPASALRAEKQKQSHIPSFFFFFEDLSKAVFFELIKVSEENAPEVYTKPFHLWPLSAKKAIEFSFEYIKKINEVCASNQIQPIFVWVPNPLGIPGECIPNRQKFHAEHSLYDCNGLVEKLTEFCIRNKVYFVDTRSMFLKIKKQRADPLYFEIDGHWNENGHLAMFGILQKIMKQSLDVQ